MRLTVRAGEVREGDRLIVPDENGGEREMVVPDGYPRGSDCHLHRCLVPGSGLAPHTGHAIVRAEYERVVVERPDPPITITVELTAQEANACTGGYHSVSDENAVLAKVGAAIVAARAGDQREDSSNG